MTPGNQLLVLAGASPAGFQGTYSQMVSRTLMSRSAPQPAMMATPRGGTKVLFVHVSESAFVWAMGHDFKASMLPPTEKAQNGNQNPCKTVHCVCFSRRHWCF
jgi:hypothetical protein